jgi:hypothetical protein
MKLASGGRRDWTPTDRAASERLLAAVADSAADAVRVLQSRLSAFEARLANVEGDGHLRFRGVHQRGEAYPVGSAVTAGGSLWIAVLPVVAGDLPGKVRGLDAGG